MLPFVPPTPNPEVARMKALVDKLTAELGKLTTNLFYMEVQNDEKATRIKELEKELEGLKATQEGAATAA